MLLTALWVTVVCTQKYVFGSLMSRDNTFRLLFSVWQQKLEVRVSLDCAVFSFE